MNILALPHRLADYLCPINGLGDVYEWKRGSRIPDELLFYCQLGFMDIVNRRLNPPRMIFLGAVIGKRQYEFWQSIMGYTLHHNEGKTFASALAGVKALIGKGVPVILFGLDMFHLTYHQKFYRKIHIPGHIVLMVGYDDKNVYVHDNSKEGVQAVTTEDLRLAWAEGFPGLAGKNAYFGIEFGDAPTDDRQVISAGLSGMARRYIDPPVGFMGIKGLSRLIKDMPSWADTYDEDTIKAIYTHMVTYTGSILPMLPSELSAASAGFANPHRGCRDKMAKSLRSYASLYGGSSWPEAADSFEKSGDIIAEITSLAVSDILNCRFSANAKYVELFKCLRDFEEKAFKCFL